MKGMSYVLDLLRNPPLQKIFLTQESENKMSFDLSLKMVFTVFIIPSPSGVFKGSPKA